MRISADRLLAIVVSIAFIAAAAVGVRLSDDGPAAQLEHSRVGQSVTVDGVSVTVTDVQVGTALRQYDEIRERTAGMFVVLTVEAANASTERVLLTTTHLVSGSVRYDVYGSASGPVVDPGFAETTQIAYEVDPARIDDLTWQVAQSELITGYPMRAEIPLGIVASNADAWRAAARDRVVDLVDDRRRGLR